MLGFASGDADELGSWKEKPTTMATPIRAGRPPTKGASPIAQFSKPAGVSPERIPKIIAKPVQMKRITVTTLRSANQYSVSPKPFTDM